MSAELRVACVQLQSTHDPDENLAVCRAHIAAAVERGVDLLVFPETTSSRADTADVRVVQERLDGPFVIGMQNASRNSDVTIIVGITEQRDDAKLPYNTLLAIRAGEIVGWYRKIHLYDAFAFRESDYTSAGDGPVTTFDVGGFSIGMLTCYDVRFPEVSRLLASAGADVIALPASWVSGPLKEEHWATFSRARALENTCYLVSAAQTGGTRVGASMAVGPDGVIRAQLGHEPGVLDTTVHRSMLRTARLAMPVLEQRRLRVDDLVAPVG
ncbi:MAG: carbon-nitrogen hydrolase family protein [Actinomycetia bacterium]|nr:carbon-nitrogen hydrolase family protein [Actinomycetes bacterium]